jgi:hypothetical protein
VAKPYVPPEQGRAGQIADTLFILLLVFGALFLPIQLRLTGGSTVVDRPQTLTWETLGQNPTMQAQWEKLGFTPETAAPYITERFDYTIKPAPLAVTLVVIAGYFVFLFRHSEKEYREVIREKFDAHEQG